jgi:hypothetical protein
VQPTRKRKGSDEATVSALAVKARVPREFVQHLYDEEMAELESTSSVKNFINLIAGNRVRQRLAQRSSRTSQSASSHPEAAGT